jgi:hypothetical protein
MVTSGLSAETKTEFTKKTADKTATKANAQPLFIFIIVLNWLINDFIAADLAAGQSI